MPNDFEKNYPTYEKWLSLKASQFAKLGYPSISEDDLWAYFRLFKWKHEPSLPYHEAIKQIMDTEPNDYFTYASLEAQVHSPSSLEDMDLDGLL